MEVGMYRFILIFSLVLISCTHYDLDKDFLKPVDALKYEAYAEYSCQGEWRQAVGTASCQYNENDEAILNVKLPPTHGTVSIKSCQNSETKEFNNESFIHINWPLPNRNHSCPIIINIAGYDSGINMFKFYPYVYNDTHPKFNMNIIYNNAKYVGQLHKQLPSGSNFYVEVTLQSVSGKIMVSSTCDILQPVEMITTFTMETKKFPILIKRLDKGFCPISIAIKYDDSTIEEGEIYVDYFDNRYIPLQAPIMNKDKMCPPMGARFFEVDELPTRRCRKADKQSHAWTRIGRTSFLKK